MSETLFDRLMNVAIFPLILCAVALLIFGWAPLIWAIHSWYTWWWNGVFW